MSAGGEWVRRPPDLAGDSGRAARSTQAVWASVTWGWKEVLHRAFQRIRFHNAYAIVLYILVASTKINYCFYHRYCYLDLCQAHRGYYIKRANHTGPPRVPGKATASETVDAILLSQTPKKHWIAAYYLPAIIDYGTRVVLSIFHHSPWIKD